MANVAQYSKNIIATSVVIANGTGTATANLLGTKLIGVIFPATMTNTAFDIEFSLDGSTYYDVHNQAGTKQTLAVANGLVSIPIDLSYLLEGFIRLNGSNEGAERTVTFLSKPL